MKPIPNLLLLLAGILPLSGAEVRPIQDLPLDEKKVHSIPVARNRVTTITFPGPITALDASLVTLDGTTPGLFQLSHQPGSSFFSVRGLAKDASTNLNVRWNNRTFVLLLQESEKPILSAIFRQAASHSSMPVSAVTPAMLVTLLDKAKVFPMLKEHQPAAVEGVEQLRYKEPPVMDYGEYEVRLREVFRFEAEDTLIFGITLKNKTAKPIRIRTDAFGVRVGAQFYTQSISDVPGTIPANGESSGYFAITGTPEGGRNELSLKNEFIILVEREEIPEPTPGRTPKPKSKSSKKGRK